jgi:hypothetical protein
VSEFFLISVLRECQVAGFKVGLERKRTRGGGENRKERNKERERRGRLRFSCTTSEKPMDRENCLHRYVTARAAS